MKMLLVLSWRYSFLSKLVVFGVYFYKPKDRNFKLHKISSSQMRSFTSRCSILLQYRRLVITTAHTHTHTHTI